MDISLVLKCEVIILSGNIKQENPGRQFFYPVDNKEIPNIFSKCFHQHFNEMSINILTKMILTKMSINILTKMILTKMLIDILENVPIFLKMLRYLFIKNIISVGRQRTGARWPPTRRTSVWGCGGRRARRGTVAPGRCPASSSQPRSHGRSGGGMHDSEGRGGRGGHGDRRW
jgi:hypothetical protein